MTADKNICIVDGKNGWGKTTFQNALRYCLYGVDSSTNERYENVNKQARKSADPKMMVQMYFDHKGRNYPPGP